jgi:ariadne-1
VQGYKQIVECRRILKWSYAYGFYVFDTLSLPNDAKQERDEINSRKVFFEHLQGRAEAELELLSKSVENDCHQFGKQRPEQAHDWEVV